MALWNSTFDATFDSTFGATFGAKFDAFFDATIDATFDGNSSHYSCVLFVSDEFLEVTDTKRVLNCY